jgi:hypothetical protein
VIGVATRGALPRLRGRGEQGKVVRRFRVLSTLYRACLSLHTQRRRAGPAIVRWLPTASHLSRRRLGEGGIEARSAGATAKSERFFLEEFTFKSARERLSKAFQLVSLEIGADGEQPLLNRELYES